MEAFTVGSGTAQLEGFCRGVVVCGCGPLFQILVVPTVGGGCKYVDVQIVNLVFTRRLWRGCIPATPSATKYETDLFAYPFHRSIVGAKFPGCILPAGRVGRASKACFFFFIICLYFKKLIFGNHFSSLYVALYCYACRRLPPTPPVTDRLRRSRLSSTSPVAVGALGLS